MIDIHSHILPKIDDGATDIATTIEMLKNAEKDGTLEIVATPHFCRGYGEAKFSEVKELVKGFNKVCKAEGIRINIHYGQEVYYSHNMIEDFKQGIIGTINDSRYMLFELPMGDKLEADVFETLYELQIMGIVPILAHPERYKFIVDKPSVINRFIDEGVLFQVNAGSIKGSFGEKIKKTAEILLDHGIYNFIGSDAHNIGKRCTGISDGIRLASERNKSYKYLFEESGEKLLRNEEIDFLGKKIKEKKSFLSFFK